MHGIYTSYKDLCGSFLNIKYIININNRLDYITCRLDYITCELNKFN